MKLMIILRMMTDLDDILSNGSPPSPSSQGVGWGTRLMTTMINACNVSAWSCLTRTLLLSIMMTMIKIMMVDDDNNDD